MHEKNFIYCTKIKNDLTNFQKMLLICIGTILFVILKCILQKKMSTH